MRTFYIITGGTFSDIAPHLALSARAFGKVGRTLLPLMRDAIARVGQADMRVVLVQTRMAIGGYERSQEEQMLLDEAGVHDLITNADVEALLRHLVAREDTRGIILTAALTDFDTTAIRVNDAESPAPGRARPRLRSRDAVTLTLAGAPKLLPLVRHARRDIFLVGCKTTAGATPDEQYLAALSLLKGASCNLVLANDIRTGHHAVVTPEQARYHEGSDRNAALAGLAEMIVLRSQLHFTRTTVVPGDAVPWNSSLIPDALRTVVDHCIRAGAYKPFEGKTVGHFAVRGPHGTILTSRRKTNFNELSTVGMVQIEPIGTDEIIAYGSKPSVGGQSQRIIFAEHPEVDCIVHMHCPLLPGSQIPVREQRPYECGSHECGQNTSDGLGSFGRVKAVMLDKHGPNIVFSRDTEPAEVIRFIEANVDLKGRTDELAITT